MKKKVKKTKLKFNLGATITEPGNSVNNKTGSWRTLRPVKDPKKCTNCSFCWMFCPDMAVTEKFEIIYDYCKGCGICARACPFGAIHMEKDNK